MCRHHCWGLLPFAERRGYQPDLSASKATDHTPGGGTLDVGPVGVPALRGKPEVLGVVEGLTRTLMSPIVKAQLPMSVPCVSCTSPYPAR